MNIVTKCNQGSDSVSGQQRSRVGMDIPTFEDKGNVIVKEGVEEDLDKKKEREDGNEDGEVREEEKGMMNQAQLFLIGHSDLSL